MKGLDKKEKKIDVDIGNSMVIAWRGAEGEEGMEGRNGDGRSHTMQCTLMCGGVGHLKVV